MKSKKTQEITLEKHLRAPIVTIMGHVDHGKTSILDAIRSSNLTSRESGGITQHTGAYSVVKNNKKIIFIDTPGHEAFTSMRSRGGKVADIVILVVAANDGVMPQTKEAIEHAKQANVPIIVAINKVDIEGVNLDKVKRQLSENGILLDEYGGDISAVKVSALAKTGIDELLDTINIVSELIIDKLEIKDDNLDAFVVESQRSSKKGVITTVIVKSGKIKIKDEIGVVFKEHKIVAKVKSIIDVNTKKPISEAVGGDVVEILGFTDTPSAGDVIKLSADLNEQVTDDTRAMHVHSDVDEKKTLNVVVKADTFGTLEAIVASLEKLDYEDTKVRILLAAVGDLTESDLLVASTAPKTIIAAFKVNVARELEQDAASKKLIIRKYDVIYHLIEELQGALEGVVEIEESKAKGSGIIIQIFKLPKSGVKIAGTLVINGKFRVNDRVGIYRGSSATALHITRIKNLKEGQNEVDISKKGSETGIMFKTPYNDIEVEDRIEVI